MIDRLRLGSVEAAYDIPPRVISKNTTGLGSPDSAIVGWGGARFGTLLVVSG